MKTWSHFSLSFASVRPRSGCLRQRVWQGYQVPKPNWALIDQKPITDSAYRQGYISATSLWFSTYYHIDTKYTFGFVRLTYPSFQYRLAKSPKGGPPTLTILQRFSNKPNAWERVPYPGLEYPMMTGRLNPISSLAWSWSCGRPFSLQPGTSGVEGHKVNCMQR